MVSNHPWHDFAWIFLLIGGKLGGIPDFAAAGKLYDEKIFRFAIGGMLQHCGKQRDIHGFKNDLERKFGSWQTRK